MRYTERECQPEAEVDQKASSLTAEESSRQCIHRGREEKLGAHVPTTCTHTHPHMCTYVGGLKCYPCKPDPCTLPCAPSQSTRLSLDFLVICLCEA